MLTIKTPATSANIGPGFDCFGLALSIYNTFEVERSEIDRLENVEQRFCTPDNLFLKAYHVGCEAIGVQDHVHAIFHIDVPISRGLGSSATMIVGGLFAASALHNNALSKDTIFQLATQMEGHPDNVAPCIYGGMCISTNEEGTFITHPLQIHKDWIFTCFIPNFETSTEEARKVVPTTFKREDVILNIAHASLLIEALRLSDLPLLKIASQDKIHEPYRKQLIHEFDVVKQIVGSDAVFLISGSGSTCLSISKHSIESDTIKSVHALQHEWKVIEASLAINGTEVV